MSHTVWADVRLRTGRSNPPDVSFENDSDAHPKVRLAYDAYPFGEKPEGRAVVEFDEVLAMNWSDFDTGYLPGNPEDVQFTLIEVHDSVLIEKLGARDADGARTGYDWSMVKHYRIAFDDHGIYDVVCREIRVQYR